MNFTISRHVICSLLVSVNPVGESDSHEMDLGGLVHGLISIFRTVLAISMSLNCIWFTIRMPVKLEKTDRSDMYCIISVLHTFRYLYMFVFHSSCYWDHNWCEIILCRVFYLFIHSIITSLLFTFQAQSNISLSGVDRPLTHFCLITMNLLCFVSFGLLNYMWTITLQNNPFR